MLRRERSAWIWLGALVVIFGAYFATVHALQSESTEPAFTTQIALLAAALLSLGGVALFDWLIRLRQDRRQETPPFDERDKLIELRSSSAAYYVLILGMILVGCVMPFSANGWEIVHAALLAILIAEIVHHGLIVMGYRRGWHG